MTVRHFTPEGMLQAVPYHHVSVGTGTKHIHVSGQIARQADGLRSRPAIWPGRSPRRYATLPSVWRARARHSRTCCA
ncbi:hypothetical protein SALBM135S_09391 [Streptomyces alboniger]